MQKILIVDDDDDIRNLLKILLSNDNYEVIEASNGKQAIELLNDELALIIMDVMMPIMDGYSACMKIRETSNVPILFLTAKGQEYDKIIGFSNGADDYLVKPFVPSELQLRVRALIRRYFDYNDNPSLSNTNHNIKIGELEINEDTCKVLINDNEKILTAIEYKILLLLCKSNGKVFSTQNIYESIWQESYFHSANNTVMVHIRNLREKIESDPQNPKYIKTIWGMGYKVEH